MLNIDEEDIFVAHKRQEYRILSLSENCFSPCMWAHYTNDYNGICIGYWADNSFSSARKITYINSMEKAKSTNKLGVIEESEIDNEVYESFFYKHSDWSYEKEWRIISKQEEKFFNYSTDDLACILLGNNLNEDIRNIFIRSIDPVVPIYISKIGYRSFGINLLPNSYELVMDGSIPPYIRTTEELIKHIKSNNS